MNALREGLNKISTPSLEPLIYVFKPLVRISGPLYISTQRDAIPHIPKHDFLLYCWSLSSQHAP